MPLDRLGRVAVERVTDRGRESAGDATGPLAPDSVWARLGAALGPEGQRPCLRDGLERGDFVTRRGEPYAVLKNAAAGTYLRVGPSERFLLDLMDGQHTLRDLVLAYLARYGALAPGRVASLVDTLHARHLLTGEPRPVYPLLAARLAPAARRGGPLATARRLLGLTIELGWVERWLRQQHHAWGWALYTPAGLALCTTLAVLGLVLWLVAGLRGEPSPLAFVTAPWIVAALLSLGALPVAVFHELAHALTIVHYGRAVRRVELRLVWGMPTIYVDTRDAWLAPRGARMAVAVAGSVSSFVVGGAAAIVLALTPATPIDPFLDGVVFVGYVLGLVHLVPALELDGYHLLMEWLEIPLLGPRALAFVRQDLWRKLRGREPWTREERVLLLYGLFAAASTVVVALFGVLLWWMRAFHLLDVAETAEGILQLWFLASALGVVVVLVVVLARLLWLSGRISRSGIVYLAHLAREGRVQAALDVLREVDALRDLPPETLRALAGALQQRTVPAGATVVRQGERADSFYILAEGEATVSRQHSGGEELLAFLRPGDYFGEASLIRQTARMATVRALTDLRLLRLGAAQFHRLLAGQVPEQTADAIAARDDLARCGLLSHLGPRELELLRAHLAEESYPAGAVIVRQGDAGDRFYILRQGRCEVFVHDERGERLVNVLGPGDYFGEIALLQRSPRTATVCAAEATTLWTLTARDFDDVLQRYFDLGGLLSRTARQRATSAGAAPATDEALARAQPKGGRDEIVPGQDGGRRDSDQR